MRLDHLTPLAQSAVHRPPGQGLVLAAIVGATAALGWMVRSGERRASADRRRALAESREDGRAAGMEEGFDLGYQCLLADQGVPSLPVRRGRRRG